MFSNRLSVSFSKSNTKRISWRKILATKQRSAERKRRRTHNVMSICVFGKCKRNDSVRIKMLNEKTNKRWITNKQTKQHFRWLSCGVRLLIKTKRMCVVSARAFCCASFSVRALISMHNFLCSTVDAIKARTFLTRRFFLVSYMRSILRLMSTFQNGYNPFFGWNNEWIHGIWIFVWCRKPVHSFFLLNECCLLSKLRFLVSSLYFIVCLSMASLAAYLNEYQMHSRFEFFIRSFHEFWTRCIVGFGLLYSFFVEKRKISVCR